MPLKIMSLTDAAAERVREIIEDSDKPVIGRARRHQECRLRRAGLHARLRRRAGQGRRPRRGQGRPRLRRAQGDAVPARHGDGFRGGQARLRASPSRTPTRPANAAAARACSSSRPTSRPSPKPAAPPPSRSRLVALATSATFPACFNLIPAQGPGHPCDIDGSGDCRSECGSRPLIDGVFPCLLPLPQSRGFDHHSA